MSVIMKMSVWLFFITRDVSLSLSPVTGLSSCGRGSGFQGGVRKCLLCLYGVMYTQTNPELRIIPHIWSNTQPVYTMVVFLFCGRLGRRLKNMSGLAFVVL